MSAPENPKLFKGEFVATEVTLRDMFAAFAMASPYTPVYSKNTELVPDELAECAYRIADAMLEVRAQ